MKTLWKNILADALTLQVGDVLLLLPKIKSIPINTPNEQMVSKFRVVLSDYRNYPDLDAYLNAVNEVMPSYQYLDTLLVIGVLRWYNILNPTTPKLIMQYIAANIIIATIIIQVFTEDWNELCQTTS